MSSPPVRPGSRRRMIEMLGSSMPDDSLAAGLRMETVRIVGEQEEAVLVRIGTRRQLRTVIKRLGPALAHGRAKVRAESLEALTEQLLRQRFAIDPVDGPQAALAAELRHRIIATHGLLTARQIAERTDAPEPERGLLAERWHREAAIFSVPHEGRTGFPGFQFDARTGRPLPAIAVVLAAARGRLDGWSLAYWFVTPNGWLPDDAAPVEWLERDQQAVVTALLQHLGGPDAF